MDIAKLNELKDDEHSKLPLSLKNLHSDEALHSLANGYQKCEQAVTLKNRPQAHRLA